MDTTQLDHYLTKNPRKTFWVVVLISGLIALGMLVSTWNIQFWPTDAEVYYLPAARELPSLKYLSQIHQSLDEERIKWLHGKEIHVLAISVFQRLMHDTETLRPLMLVGILSVFGSSVLTFVIARLLWGALAGLLVWFLFATSFWPYLYILFAKHQTQGLVFFLLSAFFLLGGLKKRFNFVFMTAAGASLAVSLYSSTVSALYFPYAAALFCYVAWQKKEGLIAVLKDAGCFALGFAVIVVWVNVPNIGYNLKSYVEYVRISSAFNHFYYNQSNLVQWIPSFDLKDTRGGWNWIIRYFFLIMPVMFLLYLASAGYLLRRWWLTKNWVILAAVALSFSSPVLAEIKCVAQYGANYFTVFVGFLFLIGYAASIFFKEDHKPVVQKAVLGALALQIVVNFWTFTTDIYPTRMVTTRLSNKIEELNVHKLATYRDHPLRSNIIDHLTKDVLNKIQWTPIQSMMEVNDGYIILPPVSTDSIYRASISDYTDFDADPFLTEMVRQGKLKNYAVASLPTLSSSRIWAQEEEIFAYRTLVLNQFPRKDKTKVWILDAAAISRDKMKFIPPREELQRISDHVENIGSAAQARIFKGQRIDNDQSMILKGLATRVYKVGNPNDSLVAYIYKVEATQPMWVPNDKHFASRPVFSRDISNDSQGGLVQFEFDGPVTLDPGPHLIVIYRTGRGSDRDFYRIYKDFIGRIQ